MFLFFFQSFSGVLEIQLHGSQSGLPYCAIPEALFIFLQTAPAGGNRTSERYTGDALVQANVSQTGASETSTLTSSLDHSDAKDQWANLWKILSFLEHPFH